MEIDFLKEARQAEEEIIQDRRWLHSHAETGFALTETLQYVKEKLISLGCEPVLCGKAGLYTDIGSDRSKKVFLLRADMDALAIKEETDSLFACQNGCMHACGHDMHTAMLLGAARLLKAHEREINGTVRLMFQPAEEILEGSQDMIENGILQNVDAALMIHVMSGVPVPAGTVIVSSPGVSAPAADFFAVSVQGKGCHGSAPQQGIDALTAAAHILIALQEIPARELGSADEAVLTVGCLHAGNAANVIADTAVMKGSCRTFDEKLRSVIKTRIQQIACGVGNAFRTKVEVVFESGCPVLENDEQLSKKAAVNTAQLLGKNRVFTTNMLSSGKSSQSGGSEDFAYVSQKVPSVMLALAAGEPEKGYLYPLHHPKVTFDESVLAAGSAVYAQNAFCWLETV